MFYCREISRMLLVQKFGLLYRQASLNTIYPCSLMNKISLLSNNCTPKYYKCAKALRAPQIIIQISPYQNTSHNDSLQLIYSVNDLAGCSIHSVKPYTELHKWVEFCEYCSTQGVFLLFSLLLRISVLVIIKCEDFQSITGRIFDYTSTNYCWLILSLQCLPKLDFFMNYSVSVLIQLCAGRGFETPILLLSFIISIYFRLSDMIDERQKLRLSRVHSDDTPDRNRVSIISPEQESELKRISEFPQADTIEIIKSDGTVLCSFKNHSHLQIIAIAQIRKEVIDYSRKLSLDAYDNDVNELLVRGLYVCFRVRQNIIFYIVACSTYSFTSAQEIINCVMSAYDDTILEIFGQQKIPKHLAQNQLSKLAGISKKIRCIVKQKSHQNSRKASIISRKTGSFIADVSHSSHKINQRAQSLIERQYSSEEILENSRELKEESRRLNIWMLLKKYLLLVFGVVCFVIICYMYSNYY